MCARLHRCHRPRQRAQLCWEHYWRVSQHAPTRHTHPQGNRQASTCDAATAHASVLSCANSRPRPLLLLKPCSRLLRLSPGSATARSKRSDEVKMNVAIRPFDRPLYVCAADRSLIKNKLLAQQNQQPRSGGELYIYIEQKAVLLMK